MTNMTENIMTKLNSLSDLPFTISTSASNPEIIETKNNNFLQLLPRDLLIFLLNYLTNIDICRLSCVDKRLASLLHSDFVWEQIWNQRYEGLWRHKIIRSILNRRNIGWNPFNNWGAPSQGWKLFVFEFEYGQSSP